MLSYLKDFPSSEFHSSIVLKKTDHGFHTGIVYRDSDEGSVSILHLAFHIDLINDDFKTLNTESNLWGESDFWVIPIEFEISFQRTLSAYCSNILTRNEILMKESLDKGIMYGLLSGDSRFIDDGSLILGKGCSGLSCSSFVIAVFNSIGIKLVDMSKWPSRPSDIEHHTLLLSWLKGRCLKLGHTEHYQRVEKEVGCPRVRPSEATAALRFEEKPADHESIWKLGESIETLVIEKRVA